MKIKRIAIVTLILASMSLAAFGFDEITGTQQDRLIRELVTSMNEVRTNANLSTSVGFTAGSMTVQTNQTIGGTLTTKGVTTSSNTVELGTVSVAGGQTNAGVFVVKGATTVSNLTNLGTASIAGVATFTAAPVLTQMITTGTNTAILGTCPGPLVTNTPIWFKVTSTNGTTYVVPAYVSP
jgi:hypothetical protein